MILIVWLLKIIVSTMTLLKIVTIFFRDDIWPENNSEESSSGDENISDIHSDVGNNNDNIELEPVIGQ